MISGKESEKVAVAEPKKTEEPDEEGDNIKETISPTASEDLLEPAVERESWGSKFSYLLTLAGYAVGFGNIWRFPYLLQENGGIVFMIPYLVSVIFLGVPIFYLELALGQRLRKGPVGSWHEVSPYLGGMGLTTGVTCILVTLYYNTLVAWVISYIFDTFRSALLYSSCDLAVKAGNCTSTNLTTECENCNKAGASQYYWNKRVLDISSGISDPGEFNWWICICLVVAWALVYGVLVKGLKAAGKIVYFTALFPYVVLIIFFIRGLLLEDMANGYRVLFTPQWEILGDATVWKIAAAQIFFSLGIGYGCLIAFASYLKPNNDCHSDAIVIAMVNCGTSVFATLVMFPFLGYHGTKIFKQCKIDRQVTLTRAFGFLPTDNITFPDDGGVSFYSKDGSDYALSIPLGMDVFRFQNCTLRESIEASASGTGLVFIVFAQAISTIPGSQFWACLFFFMLLTLGIDSSFGTLEGALASIVDLQIKTKKWIITSAVCGLCFLFSLMFSWGWGQYILTFMDDYTANWPLLIIGFVECFGIAWVYGLQRFARDLALMTGKRPGLYWLLCWKYISPTLVFFIMVFTIIDVIKIGGVNYNVWDDTQGKLVSVPYPTYAVILGFGITVFIISWIPLIAILRRLGVNVIKDEAPANFPEEELKKERNYHEKDEVPTDSVTKLVLWGTLQKSTTDTTGSDGQLRSISPTTSTAENAS